MSLGFWETLTSIQAQGTAITAAARTSMTVGSTQARFTLPANKVKQVGDMFWLKATGIISSVVATPGTGRFDLGFGANVVFDTQAMSLNTTAKTSVPWILDVLGTVRAVGTNANIMWQGTWESEDLVGSPLPTVGGSGVVSVPYNIDPPVVGASFDSTVTQFIDFFFTQTLTTGSCSLNQLMVSFLTSTGY